MGTLNTAQNNHTSRATVPCTDTLHCKDATILQGGESIKLLSTIQPGLVLRARKGREVMEKRAHHGRYSGSPAARGKYRFRLQNNFNLKEREQVGSRVENSFKMILWNHVLVPALPLICYGSWMGDTSLI